MSEKLEIANIIENPTSIIRILAVSLPKQSTYFIQIVFVGTVISTSLEILRIVPLIKAAIRPLLPPNLTENEREKPVFGIASLSNPPEFAHADCSAQIVRTQIHINSSWAISLTHDKISGSMQVLNFIVMLVYAPIAPLTVFIQAFCFLYVS